MSEKKCKCRNVTFDPDDGKHKCLLCSAPFIRQRLPFRYFIKEGADIDLKSLCEPILIHEGNIKLPYLPKTYARIPDEWIDEQMEKHGITDDALIIFDEESLVPEEVWNEKNKLGTKRKDNVRPDGWVSGKIQDIEHIQV